MLSDEFLKAKVPEAEERRPAAEHGSRAQLRQRPAMYISKKSISRRTVLRGAGASIALPLLDAMIPAGTALAATAAAPMPRMGFIYFPHGAIMKSWVPEQTGTGFALSPILKPLEPFRSHLTIVSGLRNKGGESSDPHGIMAGTWLSCYGIKDRKEDLGTTADQLAARHFGADTPLPSLELAGEGGAATCNQGGGGCGYRQHHRVPHALPAAAHGGQPAQGVLRSCSARATTRRSARRSSARPDSPARLRDG